MSLCLTFGGSNNLRVFPGSNSPVDGHEWGHWHRKPIQTPQPTATSSNNSSNTGPGTTTKPYTFKTTLSGLLLIEYVVFTDFRFTWLMGMFSQQWFQLQQREPQKWILKDPESSKAFLKTPLLISRRSYNGLAWISSAMSTNVWIWRIFPLQIHPLFSGEKIGTSCISHVGGRSAVG